MRAVMFVIVFFSSRRRHTRFDCDWSSDVCSSDLPVYESYQSRRSAQLHRASGFGGRAEERDTAEFTADVDWARECRGFDRGSGTGVRSEERRGGEECRSRWSPDHLKKKKEQREPR